MKLIKKLHAILLKFIFFQFDSEVISQDKTKINWWNRQSSSSIYIWKNNSFWSGMTYFSIMRKKRPATKIVIQLTSNLMYWRCTQGNNEKLNLITYYEFHVLLSVNKKTFRLVYLKNNSRIMRIVEKLKEYNFKATDAKIFYLILWFNRIGLDDKTLFICFTNKLSFTLLHDSWVLFSFNTDYI